MRSSSRLNSYRHAGFVALAFASACASASSDPAIRDNVEYRDIRGNSVAALVASLDRLAIADTEGHRFYGNTHWELRWNFRVESDGGDCSISSVDVDLDVRTTLPRWNPPPLAHRDLVNRWNRFSKALKTHEDGHRTIAIEAAREIANRIGKTAPTRDCDRMKQTIGNLADRIMRDYKLKERRYDESTDHGRRQGAVFP